MKKIFLIAALLSICAGPAKAAEPSSPNFFLIQDFNSQDYANRVGGSVGKWELDPKDTSQWCNVSFSPDNAVFMEAGSSLRIDYNIASSKENRVTGQEGFSQGEVGAHAKSFNGVYMLLKGFDASPYKFLSFRIKGDAKEGFTRAFKIELKDGQRNAAAMVEGVTDSWQIFQIPLSQFGSAIRLSSLTEFVIVFDDRVSRPRGTIYLDQVGFSKAKETPATPGGRDLHEPAETFVSKVKTAPKIDGVIKEWGKPRFELGKNNVEFGQFKGEKNSSAKIYLSWDEKYLYFAAEVLDDDVVCLKTGEEIYKTDGIEAFFDPGNDGFEWKNPKDVQIGMTPASPLGKPQVWSYFQKSEPTRNEVMFEARLTKKGYEIEAAMSWNFLQFKPAPWEAFGFSAALHDVDPKDARDAKLNWIFVKDPANAGKFKLGVIKLLDR